MKFIGKVVLGTIVAIVTIIVLIAACTAAGVAPSPTQSPEARATATLPAATKAAAATPAATPAPAAKPLTVTGSGISKTAKFPLAGDYVVTWTMGQTDGSSYFSAMLSSTDVTVFEMIGNSTEASGTTNLYGLDAADYYLDANSFGGKWTVTFTPAP